MTGGSDAYAAVAARIRREDGGVGGTEAGGGGADDRVAGRGMVGRGAAERALMLFSRSKPRAGVS